MPAVLTMTGECRSRSIELRAAPPERAPVPATLPPYSLFEPDDMLLGWILKEGGLARSGGVFSAYLWPEERSDSLFARWQMPAGFHYPETMPGWMRTAADELRAVLSGGSAPQAGTVRSGAGLERKFRISGAAHTIFKDTAFIPGELSVSWICGDGDPVQRFRMTLRPDRLARSLEARSWVGTHRGGYPGDTPLWAVEAAEQCRLDMHAAR